MGKVKSIAALLVIFSVSSFIIVLKTLVPENSGAMGAYLNGKFPSTNSNWKTEISLSGLLFNQPMWLRKIPNQDAFLLTLKTGQICLIEKEEEYTKKMVLDITDQVFSYDDAGLFDLAYHPEFADENSDNRGYIYIYYSYLPSNFENPDLYSYYRLSRFYYDQEDKEIDPDSELVLIQHFDRDNWHNGGSMFFDNDGFLNFSVGDEGGKRDEYDNGQYIDERLFSGILRIDVDMNPSMSHPIRRFPESPDDLPDGWPDDINQNYFIPNDNPWVSTDEDWLEEFYIIGLRSPHNVFYDASTDEIWVTDVGQWNREELNKFKRGDNGQWPYMEGTASGQREKPEEVLGNERPPILDYNRTVGKSIIGGFIYQGTKFPDLTGKYIFGDFKTQDVWCLDTASYKVTHLTNTTTESGNFGMVSFAEGLDEEIFLLQIYSPALGAGAILSLSRPDLSTIQAPDSLSKLGIFEDLESLDPVRGVIPYEMNTELYSDGAKKQRWVAIPNDGTHNSTDEQITFSETENWKYPEGTVFIKHFDMPISESDPNLMQKIETRFFIVNESESYGLTYKWNDEGTEAVLLEDADTKEFQISKKDGSCVNQTWSYPSRAQCLGCHQQNAGSVLGPSSYTMNKVISAKASSHTGNNQLSSWNSIGLFTESLEEAYISNLSATASLDDESANNETKVRSYIHVNCSFCHRPDGEEEANFDARFSVPLAEQNLIDQAAISRNSLDDNVIIKPGDPEKSEMLRRIHTKGNLRMPPLGRSLVDQKFKKVLTQWIMELGEPLAVSDRSNERFEIFPIPAKDALTLRIPYSASVRHLNVRAVTMVGTVAFEKDYTWQPELQLNPNLAPGHYILTVSSDDQYMGQSNIIIQ